MFRQDVRVGPITLLSLSLLSLNCGAPPEDETSETPMPATPTMVPATPTLAPTEPPTPDPTEPPPTPEPTEPDDGPGPGGGDGPPGGGDGPPGGGPGDNTPKPGDTETPTQVPAVSEVLNLPEELTFPEGLAYDGGQGYFYTGSFEDGAIYRGKAGETWEPWQAPGTDGRVSALGMVVDPPRRRLFVATVDGVQAYDLDRNLLLADFAAPAASNGGESFLNGLARGTDGIIYVSDSYQPRILYVDPALDGLKVWTDIPGTTMTWGAGYNLNGLAILGRTDMYAVKSNDGALWHIDLDTKVFTQVELTGSARNLMFGDGLALGSRGGLFVMLNQPDEVAQVTLGADGLTGVIAGFADASDGLMFPSSAILNEGRLFVVNSQIDQLAAGVPPQVPFTISAVVVPEVTTP